MKKNIIILAVSAILTSACTIQPKAAYFNHGQPESLLQASSEVINIPLVSDESLDQLTNWINQEQPSRAMLNCDVSTPLCAQAEEALQLYNIPVEVGSVEQVDVALMYERIQARTCEHRFIDNHSNPYNHSHPAYGCSVASNIVQSVSDKKQFVNPDLMGNQDAERALVSRGGYYNMSRDSEEDATKSIIGGIKTQ